MPVAKYWDGSQWVPTAVGPTGGSSYSQPIGDGASLSFSVVHGFGTRNVSVSCYLTAAPYNEVTVDVERTDANTVTVRTEGPPIATGAYTVIVAAAGATTMLSSGLNITMAPWHVVNAPGEPAFGASFGYSGAEVVGFRKFPDGKVKLKGFVTGPGAGGVAFTLPVGYCPPQNYRRFTVSALAGVATTWARVYVAANGTVTCENNNSATAWDLSGIEFDTETVQQTASVAAQPLDSVHYVDTPSGTTGEPRFLNGWVNYAVGEALVAFRKDPFGVVRLRGCIKSGVMGQNVFVLPPGYWPKASTRFTVFSANTVGYAYVNASGGVFVLTGTNDYIDLNGIEFDTESVTSYATGSLPGPALVGALPVSPVDGQECYFQSAAMVTAGVSPWHLRYRLASANAYKWETVGAAPWLVEIDAVYTLSVPLTWTDWPGGGLSIALPQPGDYIIDFGATLSPAGAQGIYISPVGPGYGLSGTNIAYLSAAAGTVSISIARRRRGNGLSGTLRLQYDSTAATGVAEKAFLGVTPIRVGP